MAELLILARDKKNDDPVKNRRILKRGHVVAVYEDGKCREALKDELGPVFILVKIPNTDASRFQKYLNEFLNADGSVYKNREWIVDIDSLCTAGQLDVKAEELKIEIKATTAKPGELSWDTAKACISNARTGTADGAI